MSSAVQSVLFDKSQWTISQAKRWLLDHDFVYKKVDVTDKYIRFRQISPTIAKKHGFNKYFTKKVGDDVMLVITYKG
jgi:hypothetical protein